MKELFKQVKEASKITHTISDNQFNALLLDLAKITRLKKDEIIEANKKDLERMDTSDSKYDRLKLTEERIYGIATDLEQVASLDSPLHIEFDYKKTSSQLSIKKVTVPLGVIGIIYESRPNVTFDVFALCLKSGNACLLKGGSDAEFSNKTIVAIIKECINNHGLAKSLIELLPPTREATHELLHAHDYVDIIIPRGSQKLINYVRSNASVPVIETGAGIVHTYVDEFADLQKAQKVITNAKTRRVSVCNALDCLILHESRLIDLYELVSELSAYNVSIFADAKAFVQLKGVYPDDLLLPATEQHFGTEFLDYIMSIKTVSSIDEALNHIDKYSSKHSEAIITENEELANLFQMAVDSAVVYVNTSTAFTDGAQFGLGAEIGISTQKLHARGPMALAELTSYKWLIESNGITRT